MCEGLIYGVKKGFMSWLSQLCRSWYTINLFKNAYSQIFSEKKKALYYYVQTIDTYHMTVNTVADYCGDFTKHLLEVPVRTEWNHYEGGLCKY